MIDRRAHKYTRVDADTGEEVAAEDIMKGFKVDTDTYVEVTKEELENVAADRWGKRGRGALNWA